MTFRGAIKRIAEEALVTSGAAGLARLRMSGRTLVLAYHNIVPDDSPLAGDIPNHLPLSLFTAQLSALRMTHDVVPLTDALHPRSGHSSKPRAVITLDDAYKGAIVYGVTELVRQELPATIFVAPAFVGGRSFWWDALSTYPAGGLDPEVRNIALHELRGDDDAIRAWAERAGRARVAVPEVARAATEEEIIRAASLPGITLGSHSWSHPNLTRLDPGQLEDELSRSLAWLRDRVRDPLPWIAFPYGCFNRAVARAAAAAGYQAGLGISGGWLPRTPIDLFGLPRLNIPQGLSLRGFVLRGAGIGR